MECDVLGPFKEPEVRRMVVIESTSWASKARHNATPSIARSIQGIHTVGNFEEVVGTFHSSSFNKIQFGKRLAL